MKFQYWFDMPNKWTFNMTKINRYLAKVIQHHKKILIPFAGEYRFTEFPFLEFIYCDIEENLPKPYLKGNIMDLLPTLGKFDLIISDPPYSMHQAHISYNNKDMIQMTALKLQYDDHLENHGEIIHFGFNSTGMAKKRGYVKHELCIVNGGGEHNDILILREQKQHLL